MIMTVTAGVIITFASLAIVLLFVILGGSL